ncbi:MAG: HlyD family efflux transporter periplasmic adaptor subunit [Cyanomargarita calcarea GSE-NOS-MK-12-04C]|jgi:HlyD family secretion protein|uniref:HlyD family efflux transporter periplasmic adaptor subunit n=1 Tax=Cyanomargarita calcarea GSE-NOS-MK-12-04C TaxID=2839659 RepID=A0A951QPB6_9CYAN|nr:HlyD family efflux transporter periplasmic adaptor subunit [Cyanomargarita calcarea GSE-NOS-MK-12-04C]
MAIIIESLPLEENLSTAPLLKDAETLYGGTAATVAVIPNTQAQESKKLTTSAFQQVPKTPENWSASLQTVLDYPPATFPNHLVVGGIVFCMTFAVWATFGNIDEVGKASGRLAPQGELYKIHPVVSGKVAHVYVKEGELVKAGQVIAEIDNKIAQNQVERLQQERMALQTELIQTDALVDKTNLELETRVEIASSEQKAQESAIASAQARLAANQQLMNQLQAQQAANRERHQQLKPLLAKSKELLKQRQQESLAYKERLERLKPLLAEGAISRDLVFQAEQGLREHETAIIKNQLEETPIVRDRLFEASQAEAQTARTITQNQGEIQQAVTEIKRLQAELVQKQAEASTTRLQAQQKIQQLQVQKTQVAAKVQETQKQLEKAKTELKQLLLTSPVDGMILSLNIRNAGEVVQSGQTIAEMAPQNAPLVLQAILPNREAGFVKVGKTAQVKFDAFPYQDYGIVRGKVLSISPDTKPDERLGAVYHVEIGLDRNYITANQQTIKFKAGQTASAEIIIRHRRIADILLDPIRQMQVGGVNL